MQQITGGRSYQFKVEARNFIGYSRFSNSITILAAIKPDAPLRVQTINNGSKVVISWQAPSNNQLVDYGDYIDSYKVYIMHND